MASKTFYGLETLIFWPQIKIIPMGALASFMRTKRDDHSMTLPSLAALGGSPELGHLRSAH
jgi:hypothetical protein